MTPYFVYVTMPHLACARDMARVLVQERLAACANIVPGITSIYEWKGEMVEDSECLCVLKTTQERFPALKERVVSLHPYEVPCIVALPIVDGLQDFLSWIQTQTPNNDER